MSTINTGMFAKALWPGVNKWYGKEYAEHPVEYTDLFDTYTARQAWVEDMSVSGFGLAQIKGENSSISYDTEVQGYLTRYTMATYALGFKVSKELFEDDLYDIVGERRARGLAFSIRQTKEILGALVYDRAETSGYVGGDGVVLLSTAHPNRAGGVWANKQTSDADLSEAALEDMVTLLMGFENDRGLAISVMPKSLIVPSALWADAEKLMKTQYEVGTNNNTVNVVRSRFPGGVKINHYLTDTDSWFIRTNVRDGMKYFERRADTFDMDDDFDTDNAKYKASFRCAFGFSDPRAIVGSMGG